MKIFINPGHGGNDSGAVVFGLKESAVAFDIACRLQRFLNDFNLDTKVFQFDGLETICNESNSWNADLFVSIHCNAFNGTANGTESYYFYNSATGKKLASSIHNKILNSFPQLNNRGIKQAGFYFLAGTNCPAVLVETAFIDNQHDNQLLKSRSDDFAKAIAQGILHFLGIKPDFIDSH